MGDSGSGLMRDIDSPGSPFFRSHLIGVVSFGPRFCGTKGVPGVYTKVQVGWQVYWCEGRYRWAVLQEFHAWLERTVLASKRRRARR